MLGRTLSRNVFQPAFFQELDDRVGKSSPNLTKFCRHDHKGLVNTSTEGIDELLHGLGEIDEILSKIGVFSRTPKLQFEGARESEGFRARQDGLGTPKESQNRQETTRHLEFENRQRKIEFQSNQSTNRMRLK